MIQGELKDEKHG